MKIATVIGARPQFVKAAAVSRLLAPRPGDCELLIHTGQHYDRGMSAIFFSDLGIPEPACNLGIGSGPHGEQTGRMMIALEPVLLEERPDLLLVYGDTNSTLAGALTAAKLHIPIAHVEAGLRSFNRRMPEEVNRELTDRLSRWLFCPTPAAVRNLADEGIRQGVFHTGDVMLDVHLLFAGLAEKRSTVLADQGLRRGEYFLATLHRAENTDFPERLREIFAALGDLGSPVYLPLHPRTRKAVEVSGLEMAPSVRLADPVSYFDMVVLQKKRQGGSHRLRGHAEGGLVLPHSLRHPARRNRVDGDGRGRVEPPGRGRQRGDSRRGRQFRAPGPDRDHRRLRRRHFGADHRRHSDILRSSCLSATGLPRFRPVRLDPGEGYRARGTKVYGEPRPPGGPDESTVEWRILTGPDSRCST